MAEPTPRPWLCEGQTVYELIDEPGFGPVNRWSTHIQPGQPGVGLGVAELAPIAEQIRQAWALPALIGALENAQAHLRAGNFEVDILTEIDAALALVQETE